MLRQLAKPTALLLRLIGHDVDGAGSPLLSGGLRGRFERKGVLKLNGIWNANLEKLSMVHGCHFHHFTSCCQALSVPPS